MSNTHRLLRACAALAVLACAASSTAPSGPSPAWAGDQSSAVLDFPQLLREACVPGASSSLKPSPAKQGRVEGSSLVVSIGRLRWGSLEVRDATVSVEPATAPAPCRFELKGVPGGGTLAVSGTVEWGAGPLGGDRVDLAFRADDVPVASLRESFPKRFDDSFPGVLDLEGKASGVLGETTTEEVPATPLTGDFRASADWSVLGRTSPLVVAGRFSLDDRMVRVRDASMAWEGQSLALSGWFDPYLHGRFELTGRFEKVDAAKVAAEWGVPEAWRPQATLKGKVVLEGKEPGGGIVNYEASADDLVMPMMGGWTLRTGPTMLKGQLLVSNADVSCSVRPTALRVGEYTLGATPFGMRWFNGELTASLKTETLWGGADATMTVSWRKQDGAAFVAVGRTQNADAAALAAALAPSLRLDVSGRGAVSVVGGQNAEGRARRDLRVSLLTGRIGGESVVAQLLASLASIDPAFALADAAAVVPAPRNGAGTRVDRLHMEAVRTDAGWDLGAVALRSGDFLVDVDGRLEADGTVRLEGGALVPAPLADRFTQAAPWVKALRAGGTTMIVPVVVTGTPAALKLSASPAYADLVARAKRGEAVEAPRVHEPRHVGGNDLIGIPGDPSQLAYQ